MQAAAACLHPLFICQEPININYVRFPDECFPAAAAAAPLSPSLDLVGLNLTERKDLSGKEKRRKRRKAGEGKIALELKVCLG